MQWWWILCFMPLLIFFLDDRKKRKKIKAVIVKRKHQGGLNSMTELVKNYIGKDCIIYTLDGQIAGVVESVDDKWLVVNENGNKSIVNGEFVLRIKEYPVNKKGKRKAIVD